MNKLDIDRVEFLFCVNLALLTCLFFKHDNQKIACLCIILSGHLFCFGLFWYCCGITCISNLTIMYADCHEEFECENDTIIVNKQQPNCNGRHSCAGGMINNIGYGSDGPWTGCFGARSCQSLSLLTGTVEDPGRACGYCLWLGLTQLQHHL